jgi:hypothetical protein
MKISREDIIDDINLIGHLVLEGISSYDDICSEILKDGHADVKITVNGQEIDLKSFVDHW